MLLLRLQLLKDEVKAREGRRMSWESDDKQKKMLAARKRSMMSTMENG